MDTEKAGDQSLLHMDLFTNSEKFENLEVLYKTLNKCIQNKFKKVT